MNSGTTNYLDAIHELVRDSIGSISLQRLIEGVNAITPANSPNDARATARTTVRDSWLIVSAGADRFEWLPRALRGVTVRHRLTSEEIESQRRDDSESPRRQHFPVTDILARERREPACWPLS